MGRFEMREEKHCWTPERTAVFLSEPGNAGGPGLGGGIITDLVWNVEFEVLTGRREGQEATGCMSLEAGKEI